MNRFDCEVSVSDTEMSLALGADLLNLCRRAVEETMDREEARLAEMAGVAVTTVEVGLTLTDDERIRELNRRYLGRDRPTDVIAFSLDDTTAAGAPADLAPVDELLLGDVVVSAETARSQATEYGRPFSEELARLVTHGVLHLLGHTDDGEDAATLMREKENLILTALGFSPDGPPGRS